MMQERLKKNLYHDPHLFEADFQRMLRNCRTFNDEDTVYYKCASQIDAFFQQLWAEYEMFD